MNPYFHIAAANERVAEFRGEDSISTKWQPFNFDLFSFTVKLFKPGSKKQATRASQPISIAKGVF